MSKIAVSLRGKIIAAAKGLCGYCRAPQEIVSLAFEIEHILPKAKGGTDDEENLWLACRACNSFKATQIEAIDPQTKKRIKLFNPRFQKWRRHFTLSGDKIRIIGKTACGRATVEALQLNHKIAIDARKNWVSVDWYPPKF